MSSGGRKALWPILGGARRPLFSRYAQTKMLRTSGCWRQHALKRGRFAV